ncbi:MAG TPA: SDR family NAD(P)-dependent oxidoreductase [Acidimicrobiales bacterium]|nr:SDR family NAD(P)-dependent oxidoreductase [Acidimicrobiales bacterium]
MGALEGQVAVVTGSSQGIGREVALRFAREGAAVVVNGTGSDPDALPALVARIESFGGRAVALAGSVADPVVAEALVTTARESFGDLGILVNVAGIVEPPMSSILTITVEEWRRQIDVHLHGTFLTCRAAAPLLVERGGGTIVNTSSHAFTGRFGGTGYAAGKGGVNSLTYALALDLAEHGIRVNAVAPGGRTRMSTGAEYEATIESLHRRGLLDDFMRDASLDVAPPEFTAAAYAFLASDRSAPLTGEVWAASGMYLGRFRPPAEELLAYEEQLVDGGWTVDQIADLTADRRLDAQR